MFQNCWIISRYPLYKVQIMCKYAFGIKILYFLQMGIKNMMFPYDIFYMLRTLTSLRCVNQVTPKTLWNCELSATKDKTWCMLGFLSNKMMDPSDCMESMKAISCSGCLSNNVDVCNIQLQRFIDYVDFHYCGIKRNVFGHILSQMFVALSTMPLQHCPMGSDC